MAKRTWEALSPKTRKLIVAFGIVEMGLLSAAQLDISRRPAKQIRGSKALWRLLALVSFAGPIVYFCLGRRTRELRP